MNRCGLQGRRRQSGQRPRRILPTPILWCLTGQRRALFGLPQLLLLSAGMLAGCAHRSGRVDAAMVSASRAMTPAGEEERRVVEAMWPSDFQAVHRALLTVRRRQYVADGLLTSGAYAGLRLAVVSPLGLVTEVACRSDGAREVLRATPLFPERWARHYVARDLSRLFQPLPGPMFRAELTDGRVALEIAEAEGRRRYILTPDRRQVEELQVMNDRGCVYWARFGRWHNFADWPEPLPTTIQVDADEYQLNLRMVQVKVTGSMPARQR